MKIKIHKQKYYNHQCLAIPKSVMDVYYSKLMITTRNRFGLDKISKIDTINIRVNQAYYGCSNFHFYTSINGKEEFHQTISKYDLPFWGGISKDTDKMHPRYGWICDFEDEGIDMGPNNSKKRIDFLWFVKKEKGYSKDRVKNLKREID